MLRRVTQSLCISFETLFMCLTIATLLYSAELAAAQASAGTPSWSAYDGGQYDTINLQNLNVSLNIPGFSKAGPLPVNYSLVGNDSYVYVTNFKFEPGIVQVPLTGIVDGVLGVSLTVGYTTTSNDVVCPGGSGTSTGYLGWYVQTPDGTTHWLPDGDESYSGGTNCTYSFTDSVIDGTGWSISVTGNTVDSVYTSSGVSVNSIPTEHLQYLLDPNSNEVSFRLGVITDSLGLEPLSLTNSDSATWTDVNSGSPAINTTNTGYYLRSAFNCTNVTDYNQTTTTLLPTTISFPDSTSMGLSWEATPGYSSDRTGRLAKLTLRSGATISYNYNPQNAANDGINCFYTVPNELTRTTSDGTVSYTLAFTNHGAGLYTSETDTKIDVGGNKTVYSFSGIAAYAPVTQPLTEILYYANTGSVAKPAYSTIPTRQDIYCYNGASGQPSNCPTATVTLPITEVDIYTTLVNMQTSSRTQTKYDKYGNVTYSAQYDFGASSPTLATTTSYGSWNGSACVAVGNSINDKVCTTYTYAGSTRVSQSVFTYDAHGNVLQSNYWNGSIYLQNPTYNVYNTNGTPSTTYDVDNNATTYAYSSGGYTSCGSCTNYPFPTSVTKGGLSTSYAWNGMGGVKLSATDANGKLTTYGYQSSGGIADPWWRLRSVTDPLLNETWITPTVTSNNTSFEFNSSHSIKNVTTTLDGYGRPIDVQVQESPTSSSYDTVSTGYNFSGVNPAIYKSVPCTTTSLGAQCPSSPGVTNSYDMLGRQVSSVDGGGGTVATSYNENDVATMYGPAPADENTKQVQNQYDGLGRLTSSCAISLTVNGITGCGQNVDSYSGVPTVTSYTVLSSGNQTVSHARGGQTRSKTYDPLGRTVSTVSPEGGTVTYLYDSGSTCGGSYPGHLVQKTFPTHSECYLYDSLGRLTDVGGAGLCKRYRYDGSQGILGTLPNGVSPQNSYGRMVEAETDNCTWPVTASTMITDEWFSYDADGNIIDMWELTPHSGMYYHSHATFAGNGIALTVQLENPALYTETYGLDGEGRPSTLMSGSALIVSSTTYNAASQPTYIDLGTGTDQSDYVYDPNTGRMTNWIFEVGSSKSETGTLTWNPNGTLKTLAINDGFNAGGTQTCNFNASLATGTGYDDLGRLLGVDCGSGGWGQTFSYDQYDNLTKNVISGRTGVTWNPGYNSANNQYSTGATYDNSGNLTWDTIHTYTWDPYGKLSSIDSSSCATSGECIVYDAFGHMVESSYKGTYTEIWYTQLGKTAYMLNGNSIYYAYWPTPGSGTVEINGNNVTAYYMHKDWLGNARISSVIVNPSVVSDQAYAPYSEVYDKESTGAAVPAQMFTGDTQDIVSGIWDTPGRELNASQGRWLSPDPAGSGWNQYAYPTNPNSNIDPSGLAPHLLDPAVWGTDVDSIVGVLLGTGGTSIMGNDEFDAIMGAPGTYLYTNMYGQTTFGFSIPLWSQTQNVIDAFAAGFTSPDPIFGAGVATLTTKYFLSNTSGWQTYIQDSGTDISQSGTLLNILSLTAQLGTLASSDSSIQTASENNVSRNIASYILDENNPDFQQFEVGMQQMTAMLAPLITGFTQTVTLTQQPPPPNVTIPFPPLPSIPIPPQL